MQNTPQKMAEKKRFSIVARARSFNHAFRGIGVIFRTQHNAWVQAIIGAIVITLGVWLRISTLEWGLIILAIFAVLAAEGFNTALEIDIDLTSPDEHPYARDTKDVAAGAVLLTVFGAIGVGLLVFLPKILSL
jgi:diacylglycerol kinase (ATP)